MKEFVLWGARGQARVLREALAGSDYKLVALFDNAAVDPPFDDVPLFTGTQGFQHWAAQQKSCADISFCVAVGGMNGRARLSLHDFLLAAKLIPLTVVHRTAFVAVDADVGEGCQILAQSAVCSHARLGRSVIVNTSASVDHDCEIDDGVHIGPGAHLAGEVVVGAGAFVGVGAIVLPRIHIGADAVVGAGAVVTRDVPPGVTVIGVPARPRENIV